MDYTLEIKEEVAFLHAAEKKQTQAQFRDYIRFLRLLKSQDCTTQTQAANQVNLSLRQAQRVWQLYRKDGFETLIRPRPSTYMGKLSTIQMSHLRQFLLDDQAQTLEDIRAYLAGSLGVSYTIGGVFDLCKRLKIKAKTGRPVHAHQAPGAVESYKKKFADLSADFGHQAIVFHDELRTGTRTELGRKWAPVGHRPISPVHIGYESVYLYLALCPFTGQGYAAFLPKLNAEWFGWFLVQINASLDRKTLFVADGATAHKAALFTDTKLTFSRLPAACPELNPVERIFKEVRRRLKHRLFSSLSEAQDRVKVILETLFDSPQTIINLACFPYILDTSY